MNKGADPWHVDAQNPPADSRVDAPCQEGCNGHANRRCAATLAAHVVAAFAAQFADLSGILAMLAAVVSERPIRRNLTPAAGMRAPRRLAGVRLRRLIYWFGRHADRGRNFRTSRAPSHFTGDGNYVPKDVMFIHIERTDANVDA
jgi:hypothetical protein